MCELADSALGVARGRYPKLIGTHVNHPPYSTMSLSICNDIDKSQRNVTLRFHYNQIKIQRLTNLLFFMS